MTDINRVISLSRGRHGQSLASCPIQTVPQENHHDRPPLPARTWRCRAGGRLRVHPGAQQSTLNKLIADAGLADTLRGAGPFTVFAPSDEAFKAVPAKTMQELASNKELLKSVLSFHVVPGKVMAADVKIGNVKTVQGANIALGRAGTFVTVEDAMVQQADVQATNGVVHVIDRVLMPPKR